MGNLSSTVNTGFSTLTTGLNATNSNLSNLSSTVNISLATLTANVDNLSLTKADKTELGITNANVNALSNTVGNLNTTLTASINSVSSTLNTSLANTNASVTSLSGTLSTTTGLVTTATTNIASLSTTVGSLTTQVGSISTTLANTNASVTSLSGTLSTANTNIASISTTLGIPTSSNITNTIVKRDASGNFIAGTITATLSGNASSATVANNISNSNTGLLYQSSGTTSVINSSNITTGYVLTAQNGLAPIWQAASGGGGGVTSITGTVNQITASTSTGAVTLSLPQAIGTSSNVQFGNITASSESVSGNLSGTTASFSEVISAKGWVQAIRKITTSTTITASDYTIIVNQPSSNLIITLPSSGIAVGQIFQITSLNSNNVDVLVATPNSGVSLFGINTYLNTTTYYTNRGNTYYSGNALKTNSSITTLTIQFDGSNYYIISSNSTSF